MEQPKFVPEPAESFEVDYLNARGIEVKDAMSRIGNFVFRGSGPEGEGKVYFEGESGDGTKIRISIKKGNNYKSPAEIAQEEKDAENAN